ncbi:MAG: hypothetical protein HDR02_02720 [Lachnospiraceae bacterium]|nr:hypothetical protein [Lachnospiraceae bacterium]
MLLPQLKKIKMQIEEGKNKVYFNKEQLLAELNELDGIEELLQESLALSTKVCPTCGRML